MPIDDTLTISIDLDQAEVTLVVGILQRAADECRATSPSDVTTDQDAGITLGQLTARWTDIAERELHCAVVNLHGERLFTVPLTSEGWYQVRAALSACVAQLSGELDDSTPADAPDRKRMYRALHLAHKIAEATNDR
ncbi:hypothetical protein [Streptomyces morookaense]|uniref:Uncharacterized protein n=1 Tax=Streptomyces morookaense TaxID=1970 RepID=A0A7Y7B8H4_STRMO|nr:hypothetical protein [Streptomyces morookaense]NVK80931.1 hypothetical protein [Streptomyces morookaense]GHF28464.1 hypothetical protein GCM10010359_33640 [Streptomyces morookaense]